MPGPREIEGVYFKVTVDYRDALDGLERVKQARAQVEGGTGASFGFGRGSSVGVGGSSFNTSGSSPFTAGAPGAGGTWGQGPSSIDQLITQGASYYNRQNVAGGIMGMLQQEARARQGAAQDVWNTQQAQAMQDEWLQASNSVRRGAVANGILGMEQAGFAQQSEEIRANAQSVNAQWLKDKSRRDDVSSGILRMEQRGFQDQFISEGRDNYRRSSVSRGIQAMEDIDSGYRNKEDYYKRQGAQYQADSDEDAMNERLMSQQGGLFDRGGIFGTGVGRKGTGFGKYIALHVGLGALAAGGRAALDNDAYNKDLSSAVTQEEKAQVALGAAGNRVKYLSSVPWVGGFAATAHEMWQEFALGDSQRDVARDQGLAMSGLTGQQAINDQMRQLKLTSAGSFNAQNTLTNQILARRAGRDGALSAAAAPYDKQILQREAELTTDIGKLSANGFFSSDLEDQAKSYGINTKGKSSDEIRQDLFNARSGGIKSIQDRSRSAQAIAGSNLDRAQSQDIGQRTINTEYAENLTSKGSAYSEYRKAMDEAKLALDGASAEDKRRIAATKLLTERTYATAQGQVYSQVSSIGWGSFSSTLAAGGRNREASIAQAWGVESAAQYAYQDALRSNDPDKLRIAGANLTAAQQGVVNAGTAAQRSKSIEQASVNIEGTQLTSRLVASQQFGRRDLVGSATSIAVGDVVAQAHRAQSLIEQQTDPDIRRQMGANEVTVLQTMKQDAVNRYRGGIAMAESPYEAQVKGFQATSAPPNLGQLIPVIDRLIQAIQTVTPKIGSALSLFQ